PARRTAPPPATPCRSRRRRSPPRPTKCSGRSPCDPTTATARSPGCSTRPPRSISSASWWAAWCASPRATSRGGSSTTSSPATPVTCCSSPGGLRAEPWCWPTCWRTPGAAARSPSPDASSRPGCRSSPLRAARCGTTGRGCCTTRAGWSSRMRSNGATRSCRASMVNGGSASDHREDFMKRWLLIAGPLLAALATPLQVNQMALLPGVRSVYANRQLQYFDLLLHESVPTIRADAVHAAGITGTGVGIAILDSGIDGLYNPDVHYPDKTVQNVKVLFNLADVFTSPVQQGADIFVENLPNSETSVGHGTHV